MNERKTINVCVFDLMALVLKPLANYKYSIVNSVSQCILICSGSLTRLVSSAQHASSSQHPRCALFHYCLLPLPLAMVVSLSLFGLVANPLCDL